MKLRFQITKEKEIRFISHLEYVRTIGRAIRRAKLPAAYSQGFNPHMKYSLASALGVGVVSYAEFVELELAEPVNPLAAAEAFMKALPRGIRVLAVDAVETNAPALMSVAGGAEYRVTIPWTWDIASAVDDFNRAETVMFEKQAPKAKEKVKKIDVKFYISNLSAIQREHETELHFHCRITHNGSMKAVDLLNALNEHYGLQIPVEKADIERLDLYRVDELGNKWPMLDSLFEQG
ncbi:MAG: TIGR03936 family radical SAM-associated protein [Succiniclasticum sp.]|uniref:TIGR03936 family radical SAM-associated protein n=1 Tax=Succiniclasticum sp. TaxID=2775030 RepID=UPI002A90FCE9|nr:TIGR03936 family radical SAM-associated protein [Succiniclasticum sp.]MDY6291395.1 TIGR03936 family radical SAM-associated protein [Succiniclasticum sp.]